MDSNNIWLKKELLSEPDDSVLQSHNKNVGLSIEEFMDVDIFVKEETYDSDSTYRNEEDKQNSGQCMKDAVSDERKNKLDEGLTITNNIPTFVEDKQKEILVEKDPLADPLLEASCGPFYCSICREPHSSMEELATHLEVHLLGNSLKCNVCGKKLLNKRTLASHMKLHLERLLSCNECDKKFHHQKDLNRHSQVHTGEKPFQCDVCKKHFHYKSTLNCHLRVHTGEKPFQCQICGKSFSQKASLRSHNKLHTDEKPHQCSLCSKKFHDIATLKRHSRAHTGEKPFQCAVCMKYFYDKSTLNCHVRVHTGIKPFQCHICSKNFSQKVSLRSHLRLHNEEKPYECSICKKNFHDGPTLKRHWRVHTGEKPFQCYICFKRFTQKVNLRNHLKLHVDAQPIQCQMCSKTFIDNSSLICHMRIHVPESTHEDDTQTKYEEAHSATSTGTDNEKIYNCEVCKLSIPDYFSFMLHMKSHVDDRLLLPNNRYSKNPYEKVVRRNFPGTSSKEVYNCDVCKEMFVCKSNLISHLKTHSIDRPYENDQHKNTIALDQENVHCSPKQEVFQCDICTESFNSSIALLIHISKHNTNAFQQNSVFSEKPSEEISTGLAGQQYIGETSRKAFIDSSSLPINISQPSSVTSLQKESSSKISVGPINVQSTVNIKVEDPLCQNDMVFPDNLSLMSIQLTKTSKSSPGTENKEKVYSIISQKSQLEKAPEISGLEPIYHYDVENESFSYSSELLKNEQRSNSSLEDVNALWKLPHLQTEVFESDACKENITEKSILRTNLTEHVLEQQKPSEITYVSSSENVDLGNLAITTKEESHQVVVSKENVIDKSTYNAETTPQRKFSPKTPTNDDISILAAFPEQLFQNDALFEYKPRKISPVQDNFVSDRIFPEINSIVKISGTSYKCVFCTQCFVDESSLISHVKIHDRNSIQNDSAIVSTSQYLEPGIEQTLYNCEVCSKNFMNDSLLKAHMIVHKKKFQCDVCGETFTLKTKYKNHYKLHSATKSFQCVVCNKTFVRFAYLRKHLERHNEMAALISRFESVPKENNTTKEKLLNLDVSHSIFG